MGGQRAVVTSEKAWQRGTRVCLSREGGKNGAVASGEAGTSGTLGGDWAELQARAALSHSGEEREFLHELYS